jgi:LysM repeat protein
MKRLLSIALVSTLMVTANSATALAQPAQHTEFTDLISLKVIETNPPLIKVAERKPEPVKPAEPPKPVVYTVVEGDNLTKIGTAHKVEWQRLWAKNTQLTHPDVLKVGDKITVPLPDETLAREIPAAVALPAITPGVEPVRTVTPPQRPSASFGGGNTYDYGYCTWYVKNRRGASLPNGLGNANTWYYRAQAMGMAVGSTPRAGAVGTTTRGSLGHVVYVESVNADGSINISEMNYQGFGVTSYRTTSASEFMYIY